MLLNFPGQSQRFNAYSQMLSQPDEAGVLGLEFADEWNNQLHAVLLPLCAFVSFDSVPAGCGRLEATGFKLFEKSFNVISGPSGTPHCATGTAGFPCTTVIGGTERVTTLPAVTTAPRPITTFGRITAHGPIKASFSILTPSAPLKWAITVARMPIALPSSIVIRCGRQVSRITS